MTKLQQCLEKAYAIIKANQDSSHEAVDPVLADAMREFATLVAEDALKMAAERVSLWVETPINGTEFDILEKDLGNEQVETVTVFKDSILSTPIDLEL